MKLLGNDKVRRDRRKWQVNASLIVVEMLTCRF